MKKKLLFLVILFVPYFPLTSLADSPPPPNGGANPGSGNTPVGGGAPIGSGILILSVLGAAYAGKKLFKTHETDFH